MCMINSFNSLGSDTEDRWSWQLRFCKRLSTNNDIDQCKSGPARSTTNSWSVLHESCHIVSWRKHDGDSVAYTRRERNHVHGKFAEIAKQLTRETDARRNLAHLRTFSSDRQTGPDVCVANSHGQTSRVNVFVSSACGNRQEQTSRIQEGQHCQQLGLSWRWKRLHCWLCPGLTSFAVFLPVTKVVQVYVRSVVRSTVVASAYSAFVHFLTKLSWLLSLFPSCLQRCCLCCDPSLCLVDYLLQHLFRLSRSVLGDTVCSLAPCVNLP